MSLGLDDSFATQWSAVKPTRIYILNGEPDSFAFQNLRDENQPVLIVERKDSGLGKFSYKSLTELKGMLKGFISAVDSYGIIGVVKIPTGSFLVVVTDCKSVGNINGSEIYSVTDTSFLPLWNTEYVDALEKQNLEKSYADLKKWINSSSFYFSYDYDITNSFQTQQANPSKAPGSPVWLNVDTRFFWNRHAIHYFIKNNLNNWVLPMVKGYIQITNVRIFGHSITLGVISRLSCLRAGTRFNARGVNDDGHVGNFVETEQIVLSDGKSASFVQIRGSVPIFWEQKFIRGMHRTIVSRGKEATAPAFKKHFEELVSRYGNQHVINLLSPAKESEKIISDAYEEHLRSYGNPDVKYASFDFHKQLGTSGMKFYMIGPLLLDSLQADLLKYGIFVTDQDGKVQLTQKGTFRTNCLDCLDRTNVTQTQIAKRALIYCLQALDVISTNQATPDALASTPLEEVHKEMWANNGDALSIAYTGTGALKSNLTRTGKLTFGGLVDDSVKSVLRTYQNNFKDNDKQDVIDYFLGLQSVSQEVEEEQDILTVQLKSRESEYIETSTLTIFVGTWNVGGANPGEDLSGWLENINPSPEFPDVYVIGFQEVVSLTGKSVWNADQTNGQLWQKQILDTINKYKKFILLRSYQLVGILLSVFVREDQIGNFREVHSEIAKVGFRGIAGNKGAVSVRFSYGESNFCFTCAHLAAGQNAVEERNKDSSDIMANTTFRTSKGQLLIKDHDFVFFFGDLNYRLNSDYSEVRKLINAKNWDKLYEYDQLGSELRKGALLKGFHEGTITFAPTYKYDVGTDIFDTSEKRRIPAYCDRILFCAQTLKQFNYKISSLMSSDHKPVCSVFQAKVKLINKEKQKQIAEELAKKLDVSVPPLLIDIDGEQNAEGNQITSTSSTSSTGSSNAFFDPFSSTDRTPPELPPKNQSTPSEVRTPPALPPKRASMDATPANTQKPAVPPKPSNVVSLLDDNNSSSSGTRPSATPPTLPPKASATTQKPQDLLSFEPPPNLFAPKPLPPTPVQTQPFANNPFFTPQPTFTPQSLQPQPLQPKPMSFQPMQSSPMYSPQSPQANPFVKGVPSTPANEDDPFAIFTGLQSTGSGTQASNVLLQPPPQATRTRQKKNQNDPFADLLQ